MYISLFDFRGLDSHMCFYSAASVCTLRGHKYDRHIRATNVPYLRTEIPCRSHQNAIAILHYITKFYPIYKVKFGKTVITIYIYIYIYIYTIYFFLPAVQYVSDTVDYVFHNRQNLFLKSKQLAEFIVGGWNRT